MEINGRLKESIDYLIKNNRVGSMSDFAKILNKQKSYISEMINGKREVSEPFVRSVVNCFPEISENWLQFGQGKIDTLDKIYDRINVVLTKEGITKREFEKGQNFFMFPGVYRNTENNPADIKIAAGWIDCLVNLYPKYSGQWLLRGTGDMLLSDDRQTAEQMPSPNSSAKVKNNPTLVDMFEDEAWFPRATATMHYYGDSMIEYPSGCILVLSKVSEYNSLINGKNYVIGTDDYCVINMIRDEGDYLMAYSTNEERLADGSLKHAPFKIYKESIRSIDLVIGCVIKDFANNSIRIK